jgi:hypothetical protein
MPEPVYIAYLEDDGACIPDKLMKHLPKTGEQLAVHHIYDGFIGLGEFCIVLVGKEERILLADIVTGTTYDHTTLKAITAPLYLVDTFKEL